MQWLNRAVRTDLRRYVPAPLRSAVQFALQQSGLIEKRAITLGLGRVEPTDTFVVSYPKSGNTWIRFLLANMQAPATTITFRNIEDFVPTAKQSPDTIAAMDAPRFIKTHAPHFEHFPRFVYVLRDVRDVAISYYHYSKQYGWYDGPLCNFVRDEWPWNDSFGSWVDHVTGALREAEKRPDDTLILHYEGLLARPLAEVYRLARFAGFDLDDERLEEVVRASSFDNLKAIEEEYGPETEGRDVTFFRSGNEKQWANTLSEDDHQALLDRFGDTLQRLGYTMSASSS
jgi:hypothetical protein